MTSCVAVFISAPSLCPGGIARKDISVDFAAQSSPVVQCDVCNSLGINSINRLAKWGIEHGKAAMMACLGLPGIRGELNFFCSAMPSRRREWARIPEALLSARFCSAESHAAEAPWPAQVHSHGTTAARCCPEEY